MVAGARGREVKKIGLGVKIQIGLGSQEGTEFETVPSRKRRRNHFPGVKVRADGADREKVEVVCQPINNLSSAYSSCTWKNESWEIHTQDLKP